MSWPTSTAGTPAYPPTSTTSRNGIGTAALVVGIVALVTSITVVGGILLGILVLVGIVLSAALVVGGVSLFHHLGGQTLAKCLQSAGNDQARAARCQQQFTSEVGS